MAAGGGGGGGNTDIKKFLKNIFFWGGGDFLHYTDMKEFLKKKNFFLRNRWSEFGIISQDCSLGDPFQKLIRRKTWPQWGGGGGGGGGVVIRT